MLNLILGICAAAFWIGAMGWYFAGDIRSAWSRYRLRWTRLD